MKKYLLIIAIVLISVSALFANYTVTYTVVGGQDEDFTYGENCWSSSPGYYTNEYSRTISSSNETWSETYNDPPFPPPWIILSFFLTRDETGYTITQTNTYNDITITIHCGGGIPNDPPMQD